MNSDARIFVAGHAGMVGSAIVRALSAGGYESLVLAERRQLDLCQHAAVEAFFARERPEYVFLAAARVGGIEANRTRAAEFLADNLKIQTNVIEAACRHGARKLLFLGSSCIYPRLAPQPIPESAFMTGPLEPTNEAYAIAKIAGIRLCQAYRAQFGFNAICLMPTNLYGPNDNFDLESSHVLPALIRKIHEARMAGAPAVSVWGSGTPRREFLHVDDLADAALFLMDRYDSPEIINVGCGEDLTIRELAQHICRTIAFHGQLEFDTSKPDGTPRKLLDVRRLSALGWKPRIRLQDGLASTYAWYVDNLAG